MDRVASLAMPPLPTSPHFMGGGLRWGARDDERRGKSIENLNVERIINFHVTSNKYLTVRG